MLRLLWLRRDWLWSPTDPIQGAHPWRVLPSDKSSIASQNSHLWLRPRGKAVPRGWYLFLIQHRGENPRTTGFLRSGCFGVRQGRPLFPIRLRLRVIHVNRARPLTLELARVPEPLQLQRLCLLRLPAWEAWRRIRRRLNRLDRHHPDTFTECWRYYNRLLCGQAGTRPLITYSQWQQEVEGPELAELPALNASQRSRFVLQVPGALAPVRADQWVVLLRPATVLAPWALAAIAQRLFGLVLNDAPVLLYGDEDLIGSRGQRHSPRFKPAWNCELFWSDPRFSSHWVVQSAVWNQLLDAQPNGFDSWWALQYNLLQFVEQQHWRGRIRHLPMVLAHSSAFHGSQAAKILEEFLKKELDSFAPHVIEASPGLRLTWACPAQTLVSVVIPTRDQLQLLQACLQSISAVPAGVDLELIVVDNGSVDRATAEFLEGFSQKPGQKVLRIDGPFNFSALNNRAAEQAGGSVLLLLNNDVELLSPNWGAELAANALRPGVGCVGAQLHYPDGTIQHGGVVLGIGGMASHAHRDLPSDAPGYQGRLQLAQEFSAVTAACLAISAEHWQQLGGLDEHELAVNYNDVDLCLRAQSAGLRNLYLPQVKAIHHESKSRGRPEGKAHRQWRSEWAVMEKRWGALLLNDPAYSPRLTLEDESWGLSFRQRPPQLR